MKYGIRTIRQLILLSFILLPSFAFAVSLPEAIKDGNRLYGEEKYPEAIGKYNEAKEEVPDSAIAHFNLGAALYKNGQYDEAVEAFTKSLNTEDRKIEAQATFNIANSKYQLGSEKADTDLNSAIATYREALDYYKRAMELDQGDSDPKYNHELVEKQLKILMEKQKNQQQQQQDQDKKDDDKKDQDGKEKKEGEEKQSEQESDKKAGQEQKDKEQQAAGKEGDEDKSGEDMKQQESAAEEGEPQEMSPEEARMLLEAYGQDEAMDNIKKGGTGRYPDVVKDW